MRSVLASVLAAAPLLTGCASWERYTEHLRGTEHPWHAYPFLGGATFAAAPFYPFAWTEGQAFHGGTVLRGNVFGALMSASAALVGLPLGTAFYVAGYPLEWVVPERERPSRKRKPAKAPQDQAPPPVEPASRDGT